MTCKGEDSSYRANSDNDTGFEILRLKNGIIPSLLQRPTKLNILAIGPAGVGKSAFISSMASALSGHFHEYALSGHHGGDTRPITFHIKRVEECGLTEKDKQRYKGCTLPTLIDMAGLPDQNPDGILEELLRTVLYGRLPKTMSIAHAMEILKEDGIQALRKKCPRSDPDLKIDRVIFVSSATERVLSLELMRCVVNTCRPSGTSSNNRDRVIPLYGVMTKTDKVDVSSESYTELEKDFQTTLGIKGSGNRFIRCINYCDDTAPDRFLVNSPRLDVPLLTFFSRLIDPNVVVDNDEEEEDFTSTTESWLTPVRRLALRLRALIIYPFLLLLSFVTLVLRLTKKMLDWPAFVFIPLFVVKCLMVLINDQYQPGRYDDVFLFIFAYLIASLIRLFSTQ